MSAENDVVIFGEILEQEPEFAESFHFHEVSIINDCDNEFSLTVERERFLDEPFFAGETDTAEIYVESVAYKSHSVCVSVHGS